MLSIATHVPLELVDVGVACSEVHEDEAKFMDSF